MKRYIEIKDHSTIKVEATGEDNVFFVVVTAMGEEIQLRLDKDGFHRKIITQKSRTAMNKEIEELKNGEFALADGEIRSGEQTELLWAKQEGLEEKYSEKCEYVVDGLNSIELYEKYSNLGLNDETIGLSNIDETIKNKE